jgi:hypothetical protein
LNQLVLAYNKTQKKTLKDIQTHLNSINEKSMFRANVTYMREIHDPHFFNPECNMCIIILNQYYHHLMGSMNIEDYYKTRGILNDIDVVLTDKFSKYKNKKKMSHSYHQLPDDYATRYKVE